MRPERGGALRSGVAPDTFAAPRETDVAKRTPLYDAHLAASARMIEFAGFDMPVQYQGLVEEHFGVRERADSSRRVAQERSECHDEREARGERRVLEVAKDP